MMGSVHIAVNTAILVLKNQDELLEIIWDNLSSAGFQSSGVLKSIICSVGILIGRTTNF
jgi:hypothetical protein